MTVDNEAHVIVCGAGPVGIFFASKLSHAGIRVTVIEALPEIPPIPKALTYTAPVLADLAKLGVLEQVADICFADEKAIWQWRTLDGKILADMHWAVLENVENPRLHKPYALQCGQHLLAKVLTEYCSKYEKTKVLFSHTLVGLSQTSDKVRLTISKEDGSLIEMEADWVIGADGGKSATRKLIGQHLDGFTWDSETFVAMNIHYPFDKYQWGAANFLIGGKRWAVVGRSGPESDPWRVAFGVDPGMTEDEVREKIAPEYLRRILPGPDPYEIVQCAQYRVHQRQVKQYKVGRVILAGDAAHLNNPIGGFGLTTGMTDAGCLSDALALVIQGKVSEDFLQFACDKRHEIFATVSNPGSQNFKRMVQQDPDNISDEDMEFFEKINVDEDFQKGALLNVMRLYTPVEDLLAEF